MNPYPLENSVLIMDNAPIHHGGEIFNPIEKVFNVLEAYMRRTQIVQNTPEDEMLETLEQVTGNVVTERLMGRLSIAGGYWA
ncbi:hypothetical protein CROQUDRAFT_87420 [Cronartium quercuum f. sp. fusiforme G11]|uniref:Tc1-like transposase DDE domain-containing protein n=1 Tax=Cronartium quercuum f. sp. fusiforme G11 TaxID=708437 RepID=A0A9P6NPL0_9BASI|nr:hypothetical protein CROQUDRAFT_87420 [Cronartium quercuum f. sp. fusiforme G11]